MFSSENVVFKSLRRTVDGVSLFRGNVSTVKLIQSKTVVA